MTRILVTPESLRDFSAQWEREASALRVIANRLGSALSSLDWQVRYSANVEGEWNQARTLANNLADQADALARFLQDKAQTFDEVDRASATSIGQVLGAFTTQQQTSSWYAQWPFSFLEHIQQAQFVVDLGNLIGDAPRVIAMPLIGIGGLVGGIFSGFRFLNPQSTQWSKPLETAATQTIEKGALARTINRGFGPLLSGKNATSSATTMPPPAQTAAPPTLPTTPEQWWRNVPNQSQQGLKYIDAKTSYGCTVSSASMILDYYHAQSPSNQTMSAQELLDANARQGEFNSTGMSASNLGDELAQLGYTATPQTDATKAELEAAVKQGPVIAVVKLFLATSGDNHAVVVTGMTEDQVRINDPWTGEARTYSWADFSKSWGANFGKGAPINSFMTIRPK